MKILSISTSSNISSVSISEDDDCILELNIDNNKTHSENLMPLIKEVFDKTNLKLSDINAVACDIGPRFFYRNSYRHFFYKSYCRKLKYTSN